MRREKQPYHSFLSRMGLLVACLLLGGWATLRAEVGQPVVSVLHRPGGLMHLAQRSSPSAGVVVRDNFVSINVRDQELSSVIESIARQGNIDVENLDEVPQTRISLRFDKLPLIDGLKRVLHTADLSGYVLVTSEQDGETHVQRILFLGATQGARSSRVAVRSGPSRRPRLRQNIREEEQRGDTEEEQRSDTSVFDDIKKNATMRRLLSQLLHTNEQVRERALERLIRMVEDDEKQAELLDTLEPLLEDLASENKEAQEQARGEIRDLLRR
jgi:hypothetical protein